MGRLFSNSTSEQGAPLPSTSEGQDAVTFDEELARHASSLKYYVRSLMPGYHGADDIAQEVLLKVWEKKQEFTPGSNFKAWVFQVARFFVMNQRRKLARSNVVLIDDELMDQIDRQWLNTEQSTSQAELDALQQCMGNLSPAEQELLRIRYATRTPLETYAMEEGVRPGALKTRLFRIREVLRRCIELRLREP